MPLTNTKPKTGTKSNLGLCNFSSNLFSFKTNTLFLGSSSALLVLISAFTLSSFFAISGNIFSNSLGSASATSDTSEARLELDTVLDISAPEAVLLNCIPGTTDNNAEMCTSNAVINVNTNNLTGYTLQMNATNGYTNSLTNNATDPVSTVDTLNGHYIASNFPINAWGYTGGSDQSSVTGGYDCTGDSNSNDNGSTSNANYCPILAYSSTGDYAPNRVLRVTNAPSANSTTNLTFAARVNTTKPSGTYVSSVTFTAVTNYVPDPITDNMYMQDIDSTVCRVTPLYSASHKVYTVKDKRDETSYTIAKLADGNCWMTQNLELGEYGSPMNLTDQLSNVGPDGYALEFDYANNSVYKGNDNKYGNYYNYSQATAGSGDAITTAGENAPYSICPKNWRLPITTTEPTDSEFYVMLNNYITTGTWKEATASSSAHWEGVTTSQYIDVPVSFVFSGSMDSNGNLYSQTYDGRWLSSTSNNYLYATFGLSINTGDGIYPRNGSLTRSNNFSMRCLVPGTQINKNLV